MIPDPITFGRLARHQVRYDIVIALWARNFHLPHFQPQMINVQPLIDGGKVADGEVQDHKAASGADADHLAG